jgi:hypothetical protein
MWYYILHPVMSTRGTGMFFSLLLSSLPMVFVFDFYCLYAELECFRSAQSIHCLPSMRKTTYRTNFRAGCL